MADPKYPVWMKHPAFQPAVIADANVTGGNIVRGRSVRFPPVMVNNADEVAYYEAQGYTATDKIDPHMFDPVPGEAAPYKFEEYPQWVANADGKNVLVQNEAQHRAANPDAFKDKPVEPPKALPPAPRTMEARITEAAALAAGGATLEEIAGVLAGQPAPPASRRGIQADATGVVVSGDVPSRQAMGNKTDVDALRNATGPIETLHYADGTSATGHDLPRLSPESAPAADMPHPSGPLPSTPAELHATTGLPVMTGPEFPPLDPSFAATQTAENQREAAQSERQAEHTGGGNVLLQSGGVGQL